MSQDAMLFYFFNTSKKDQFFLMQREYDVQGSPVRQSSNQVQQINGGSSQHEIIHAQDNCQDGTLISIDHNVVKQFDSLNSESTVRSGHLVKHLSNSSEDANNIEHLILTSSLRTTLHMDKDVGLDLPEIICSKIELQHKMIIFRNNEDCSLRSLLRMLSTYLQ